MADDYMMDDADDQQDAVRGNPESEDDSAGVEPVVIPKSACPGMDIQPGMRMTFVVDKVFEDEFTAHYEKKREEPSEAPDADAALME